MGVTDPDMPDVVAARNAWQEAYLAQVAARVSGQSPELTEADTVKVNDAATGITITKALSQVLGEVVVVTEGEAQPYSFAAAGINIEIANGSPSSPNTVPAPNVRISRVEQIPASSGGGSGLTNEKNATLVVQSEGQGDGTAGDYMQTCAIFAYANGTGTGNWDTCALNVVGQISGSATRRASAAYLEGRKDVAAAMIQAVEIRAANYSPSNNAADSTYNTGGLSNTAGLWITCHAAAAANQTLGAAIQIGRVNTAKWGVGIGFTTNGTADSDLRTDSTATTALDIRGTHTYGLDLRQATNAVPIRLANNTSIWWRNQLGTTDYEAIKVNTSNELAFGETAGQITNLRFHRGMILADQVNMVFNTSNGTKFGTATGQKFAFWNKTPIIQPTTSIAAATFVANSGTAVNDASTFGGYTLGKIAAALINVGILA